MNSLNAVTPPMQVPCHVLLIPCLLQQRLLQGVVVNVVLACVSHGGIALDSVIAAALQTLHLPCLHGAEVLLARVDLGDLVTHGVGGDVLFGALLGALGLLHGVLEHVCVGELLAADGEVDAGTHLLDFDARQLLATALGLEQVEAHLDLGVRAGVGGLLGADADQILQTLDIDLLGVLAAEQVDEKTLGKGVFCLVGVFEDGAVEGHERLQANAGLLVLELLQGAESVRVDVELEHVEELVVKGADEGEAVRALLGVQRQGEERGVVLQGEELERGGIVEGVDVVLLGEALDEGALESRQVGRGQLEDLRRLLARHEECRLGVLVLLGLAGLHGARGAGILGFAARIVSRTS
jgi:hypothetical protein